MTKMMQLLFVMNSGERRAIVVGSKKDKLADDFIYFSRSFFMNDPDSISEFKAQECESFECGVNYPHKMHKCFTDIALRVRRVESIEAIKHVEIEMED